jgi:hypothetical protein
MTLGPRSSDSAQVSSTALTASRAFRLLKSPRTLSSRTKRGSRFLIGFQQENSRCFVALSMTTNLSAARRGDRSRVRSSPCRLGPYPMNGAPAVKSPLCHLMCTKRLRRCEEFGWRRPLGLRLEFVHFGLIAKYRLNTALARLREREDRAAVGEGSADFAGAKQPSPPATPYPLGQGCYQRLLHR